MLFESLIAVINLGQKPAIGRVKPEPNKASMIMSYFSKEGKLSSFIKKLYLILLSFNLSKFILKSSVAFG